MPMIIYFDSDCLLCSRAVHFISKNTKSKDILFAPIGGTTYAILLARYPKLKDIDSIIVEEKEEVFTKALAIFSILEKLKWPLKILLVFNILPQFINNYLYTCIARNRKYFLRSTNVCLSKNHIQLLS